MKFKLTHVHPSQKQVRVVEKSVDKLVDHPVYVDREVIKHVEVPTYIDREVEKLVYVDREVPVEKIVKEVVFIDKPFPVEKIIEVFVDRPVEVVQEKLAFKTPNYIWAVLALETILLVSKYI